MPSPLRTAAISTFESLALLFAEPCDAPPGADHAASASGPALAHAVRLTFTGPFGGALVVAVSDDVACALAGNMLGLDAGTVRADPRLRQDALGELANVVCGNVLPLVGGREAVFHLGAPAPATAAAVVAEIAAAADAAGAGDGPIAALVETLDVEGGRAALALFAAPPAAPPSQPVPSAAPLRPVS